LAGQREEAIRRYCQEILPWVKERRFLTATDLGTWPADFQSLSGSDDQGLMHSMYQDMPLDAYITGVGVATAAEVAMGGLEGRTVAVEGFGKVGAAVAVEVTRRGARLVAFSTVHGCVYEPGGFDVEELLDARRSHGDHVVEHVDGEKHSAAELFSVDAGVLVPRARVGVLDQSRAAALQARLVAPAANVPYTAAGLQVLGRRGIRALADFVCNSGATIGYLTELKTPEEAIAAVDRRVGELTRFTLEHPGGAFQGARAIAEEHLRTWVAEQMPDGPPLA
jgi:glutamate dehydrogenase/leucine dehydrogenase